MDRDHAAYQRRTELSQKWIAAIRCAISDVFQKLSTQNLTVAFKMVAMFRTD